MFAQYHTYKEIKQQPAVWRKTYQQIRARKEEIRSFVEKYLSEGYRPVLTGAGTSAYIGDALEPALFGTPFREARPLATTDILTNPYLYFDAKSKVLLVSFARSGNSPESVATVKALEKAAGKVAHIFITCNEKGELARMQGDNILTVLLPPETNDLSLAMTSSYSSMMLACSLIAHIGDVEAQEQSVNLLSDAIEKAMATYEEEIRKVAGKNFERAVFLGSGPLKGLAEESRLKLQELTDGTVMCAFDTFMGFRHGPKAVVNDKTLMVYLLSPNPNVRRYELDLIRQVKANNNLVASIAVCHGKPDLEGLCDLCVEIDLPPVIPSCYGCISFIFVAQLLGMFKSIDLGLSPDSPSVSGNISRVVEGVTVYN